MTRHPPQSTLVPYTTLFRSRKVFPPSLTQLTSSGVLSTALLQSRELWVQGYHFPKVWKPEFSRLERSEEHTSELQSHSDLVCRLLLEKKNKKNENGEQHRYN